MVLGLDFDPAAVSAVNPPRAALHLLPERLCCGAEVVEAM